MQNPLACFLGHRLIRVSQDRRVLYPIPAPWQGRPYPCQMASQLFLLCHHYMKGQNLPHEVVSVKFWQWKNIYQLTEIQFLVWQSIMMLNAIDNFYMAYGSVPLW